MGSPKKVELFLIEGTPFGLRYADIKNRPIRAFVCRRASFKDLLKRDQLRKPGVYVLFNGEAESGLVQAYIGETDNLANRLTDHNKKDFWNEVIAFVSQDETLDKAGVGYIEYMLYNRANRDKLAELKNDQIPTPKTLSEANKAVMDEFTEDIVFLLTLLGYNIIRSKHLETADDGLMLYIKAKQLLARGRDTDEGFVVYAGSTASVSVTESWKQETGGYRRLREELIEKGVLVINPENAGQYLFSQDYVFSSPSASAGIIIGSPSNGRTEWKDQNGKTLKEIQENEVAAST